LIVDADTRVQVSGTLVNTGHDVRLIVDDLGPGAVNVTGGPLSYMYRVSDVLFHFGSSEHRGSEHAINNTTFAAEVTARAVLAIHRSLADLGGASGGRSIPFVSWRPKRTSYRL